MATNVQSDSGEAESSERPLLMTAQEVGELLGLSARSVWRLTAIGAAPRPIRLGGSTRWRRSEIERWVDAGCPSAATNPTE